MKPNNLHAVWNDGRCVLNGWLSIANAFSAEIMAEQGYDSITIDLQHGIVDYQAAVSMLQAMRASGVMPLVRVPWLDPASIMKALDAGAYGVICPMVNSRAEAEALVSYVRYPPYGVRSFGPSRAVISAGANYGQEANAQVLCFAMIETAEAVKNLAEIVSTPGLDGVYIGPADLTLGLTGMRYPTGFDREEPEMVGSIKKILDAAHGAGIRAALHCGSPAYATRAARWGFDMVTVSNDVRLLAGAAAASVKAFREANVKADVAAAPGNEKQPGINASY
ncbi:MULTISPECIES: aldolase/citrate lyase family protein [unclassified Mesorhizobium]|uniref:HpcH/HpaI aldolase family protein n=1 Tax=unclassified Mesorhizobium TaxID=325217 RepID=UPI002415305E|nr:MULTISPECIES: aldolase/citrate lyase family protein [unclassified Mesorhizobium]MDG4889963.1 aldolase/citrate lyase family protein [Mesorhizobium sp. WSM4887]MDG4904106.1 aldolase/citrate lyase family protein [Mesorhizobium sp. WSM4962]MDG4909133.1 aldolase/citrate lyase family protein [Mesorhizobium sp. WSM4898]MDG4921757.1 aldolase/citrate lyase family protein [Mesorhizobium sp. WSM4989]